MASKTNQIIIMRVLARLDETMVFLKCVLRHLILILYPHAHDDYTFLKSHKVQIEKYYQNDSLMTFFSRNVC